MLEALQEDTEDVVEGNTTTTELPRVRSNPDLMDSTNDLESTDLVLAPHPSAPTTDSIAANATTDEATEADAATTATLQAVSSILTSATSVRFKGPSDSEEETGLRSVKSADGSPVYATVSAIMDAFCWEFTIDISTFVFQPFSF